MATPTTHETHARPAAREESTTRGGAFLLGVLAVLATVLFLVLEHPAVLAVAAILAVAWVSHALAEGGLPLLGR